MPAIRNRPRVDVVLRVPKARPWSESDDAWSSGEMGKGTAMAVGVVGETGISVVGKGKEREEDGAAGVGASGNALGGATAVTIPESSLISAPASTTTTDPPIDGTIPGPSAGPSSSSSAAAILPPPPKTRPAETSCAEWNSLLIWARRMRGPQWDSSVGMWMVDQGSEEYYSFSSDPTQSIHSGGPSNTIPALPPHVQDHESSGVSSGSSTRPTTATANATAGAAAASVSQPHPQQQQQQDQSGHLLAPPLRTGLQHNEHSSYTSSSHSGSAPTSLDSKAVPLLHGSPHQQHQQQQQQPQQVQQAQYPLGQAFGGQQRRASPRW